MKSDLSIIYYTCNYLEKQNPFFVANTKRQLVSAIGKHPLICVSHEVVEGFPGYSGDYTNIVAGRDYELYKEGRHHLNIYKQILEGCKVAKTKYVAMAEDDILYSWEHFNTRLPLPDRLLYDMNKLSLFTWTKPPVFSFRHNRMVVNNLLAPTDLLRDGLQERFDRLPVLLKSRSLESILSVWGDPGRYEKYLGVKELPVEDFMCTNPSIVFTHPKAYGYEFNHGKKKRLGDLRIIEIPHWGRAEDVLKLWGDMPYV